MSDGTTDSNSFTLEIAIYASYRKDGNVGSTWRDPAPLMDRAYWKPGGNEHATQAQRKALGSATNSTAAIVRFMSGRWSASTRQPSASALHEPTGFYLAVDCLAPRRKGERSFAMGRPCTCGALAVVAGA
ncbi:MAG: hypothetical protein WA869_24375 [Alloacidobacterium sp.]